LILEGIEHRLLGICANRVSAGVEGLERKQIIIFITQIGRHSIRKRVILKKINKKVYSNKEKYRR